MNGTFNTVSTTATFAGGFTNNGNSNFAKAGDGTVEIDVAPTLNNASTLSVTTGTLRFKVVSGSRTIGTGVTATVSSGATLELAGTVSALTDGSNRVNIVNNSAAPGLLVSGKNQQVGNIDGSGTTQVNAGSDLTANHVIQSALVIGGTANSLGLVTIAASDASGNSLSQAAADSSGLVSFGSVASIAPPFGLATEGAAGNLAADGMSASNQSEPGPARIPGNPNGEPSAIPEPAALLLAAIGGFAVLVVAQRKRRRRTN